MKKIKNIAALSLFISTLSVLQIQANEPVALPPYAIKAIQVAAEDGLFSLRSNAENRSAASTFVFFEGSTAGNAGTRFHDWISLQPGVMVFDSFGGNDTPKLSIRGSDLGAYPSKKGVKVLLNGLPRNFADGSYIGSVFSPQTQALEILPLMSSSYAGGTTLGGAIHFISPDIIDNKQSINAQYGSYDLWSAGFQADRLIENYGIRASVKHRDQEGWRSHNTQEYSSAEILWSQKNEDQTRYVQFEHTRSQYDVSGPLNQAMLKSNPRSVSVGLVPGVNAGPNILRDRPRRDSHYTRLGARQTWNTLENESALGAYMTRLDDTFYRPVANGVEESLYWDGGLNGSHTHRWDNNGLKRSLRAQASLELGSRDQEMAHNVNTQGGAQFAKHRMNAITGTFLLGGQYESHQNLLWDASAQYNYAYRKLNDRFATPTSRPGYAAVGAIPANWSSNPSLDMSEQAGTWRLGVLKKFSPMFEYFASGYRTWEPPIFDDMVQFSGGTVNRGPTSIRVRELNPQTANTIETGVRGGHERFSWQLTAYRSWVSNEILTLDDGTGTVSSINAGSRTLHTGLESMISAQILKNALFQNDSVTLKLVGDWMDFRFKNHSIYGDNALPGVPESRIASEVQYRHAEGYYALVNVNYLPGKTPVDFQNTANYEGYAVWNLRLGRKQSSGFSWFAAVNNLMDKDYTSTAVVMEKVPTAIATAYIPGAARTLSLGIEYSW